MSIVYERLILSDVLRQRMTTERTNADFIITMNDTNTSLPENTSINKSPLAQELIWALGSLLTGLLILPALIYAVGRLMFGAYKGASSATGLAAFYADYAHDIATAHLSAWVLAVGPLLLVYFLRLVLGQIPISTLWVRKLLRKPAGS
jgi:hypothetical protein